MQRFIPAFEQLVVLVQSRVRYPETLDKMRKDEIADFRRSRYSTADVLEDAAGGARHDLRHLIACMAVPSQLQAAGASTAGQHACQYGRHRLLQRALLHCRHLERCNRWGRSSVYARDLEGLH